MGILHMEMILFTVLLMLLIASLIDARKSENDKYYMLFLVSQLNVLIFDIVFNTLNKIPENNIFFELSSFCSLLFTYAVLTAFSHAILNRTSKFRKTVSKLIKIVDISFIINSMFIILNIFNNFIFDIDSGIYNYGTFFFLLYINPSIVAVSFALVIFFIKDFAMSEKISVVLFCAFPATAIYILYLQDYDQISTSVMYIANSLSIILYYVIIRERDRKQYYLDEIKLKNQELALTLSQMKPHFIFNVLNSVEYLYDYNSEEGRKLLNNFNKYLRNNLDSIGETETIPFKTELEHVKVYVDIEETRFKERLNVIYDIKEDDFFIPTLILQPMVENAIKHGICQKIDGGTVTIKTYRENDDIIIKIIDDGIGFDTSLTDNKNHYGVKNTVERFNGFFRHSSIDIESTINVGTTVTMVIKKEDIL